MTATHKNNPTPVRLTRPLLGLTLLIVFFPTATLASSRSELLRSQAQLALNDQQTQQALDYLDQALAHDPNDAQAYTLRGSVRLNLQQPQAALDDLQTALRVGGNHAHLDRTTALAWLMLGRTQVDAARLADAYTSFHTAEGLADAELRPVARYWQAKTLAQQGNTTAARQVVGLLIQQSPDAAILPQAQQLLDELTHQGAVRRWTYGVEVGYAADSNVGLFPADQPLPATITNQADSRLQMQLDSSWRLGDKGAGTTIDYSLFQNLYQTIPGYNLQSHRLAVDWRQPRKRGAWGANYQAVYADLDSKGQQLSHTVSAYLTSTPAPRELTLSKLSLGLDSYSDPTLLGYNGNGIELSWRRFAFGSGKHDQHYYGAYLQSQGRQASSLSNTGLGIDVGIEKPYGRLDLGLTYTLALRSYELRSEQFSEARLYATAPLGKATTWEAGYKALDNGSTDTSYAYNRTLFYLSLRWQP